MTKIQKPLLVGIVVGFFIVLIGVLLFLNKGAISTSADVEKYPPFLPEAF